MADARAILMVAGACDGPVDERPWGALGYLEWHDRAYRYHKAGHRQKRCTECIKWRWDDEVCCEAPRRTKKEADREDRAIARAVRQQYPTEGDRYRKALRKAYKDGSITEAQ